MAYRITKIVILSTLNDMMVLDFQNQTFWFQIYKKKLCIGLKWREMQLKGIFSDQKSLAKLHFDRNVSK